MSTLFWIMYVVGLVVLFVLTAWMRQDNEKEFENHAPIMIVYGIFWPFVLPLFATMFAIAYFHKLVGVCVDTLVKRFLAWREFQKIQGGEE